MTDEQLATVTRLATGVSCYLGSEEREALTEVLRHRDRLTAVVRELQEQRPRLEQMSEQYQEGMYERRMADDLLDVLDALEAAERAAREAAKEDTKGAADDR